MSVSNVGQTKLETFNSRSDSFLSMISQFSDNAVNPTAPFEDVQYSELRYTHQLSYDEEPSPVLNKKHNLTIDRFSGYVGNFCVEMELPYQDAGNATIDYAPLPALAAIEYVEVWYGSHKIHELSRKEIYSRIMYNNEQHYRNDYIENDLGGSAPNGSSVVNYTSDTKVRFWLPIEGVNTERGRHSSYITPLPIGRLNGKITFKIKLDTASNYASGNTDGVPNYIRLYYQQLPIMNSSASSNVVDTGGNSSDFNYPTAKSISSQSENRSIGNTNFDKIDISDLTRQGELITLLVHIVTNTDDNNSLFFNHEPISELQLRLDNRIVAQYNSLSEYIISYRNNYKMKPWTRGSVQISNPNNVGNEPNPIIAVSISPRDIFYKDYIGHGVNPYLKSMSLWLKTSSSITADVDVIAIYRSNLHIDSNGQADMFYSPNASF